MSFGEGWSEEKRAKSDELLRRGKYRHLLASHQREFYDLVTNGKGRHYGMYSSRKVGKSATIFIMALEFAQNRPGTIQRIVLPEKTQAKEIFFDLHQQLKSVIPADLLPKLLKQEAAFQFQNGSRIVLGGSLAENIESARGPISHRIFRDEIAAWGEATYDYATYSILLPQGTTVPDFKLIDTTTPPKTPSHPWIKKDYAKLLKNGNLSVLDIYKNTLLTPEMIENIIEEYGGVDNPNFQREHLCLLVADSTLRLTPEFDEAIHVGTRPPLTDNFGNKEIFQPICPGDLGLVDNTFLLAAYHDHIRDVYVITDEWVDNHVSFDQIVAAKNALMKSNFDEDKFLSPEFPVDVFEIARHTLNVDYNWITTIPSKGRTEETIQYLRDCLINKKILIDPKCVNLINELKTAIWADNKSDIKRNNKTKHGDGIMALAYGAKAVPFGRRPTDKLPLSFNRLSSARRK